MTIKNEHWERNRVNKDFEEATKELSSSAELECFQRSQIIGILADICDNLTVISNILLNSKGGK